MNKSLFFLPVFFIISFILSSCEEPPQKKYLNYEGPEMEINNIELLYSDSARLVVKMLTAKQLDMYNRDKVYPKEVKMFFYDALGNMTTTLRADSARYVSGDNKYLMMGHVKVNKQVEQKTLETAEMTWYPDRKQVVSTKPVKATSPRDVLYGTGMTAKQDFSEWVIKNATGQLTAPISEF